MLLSSYKARGTVATDKFGTLDTVEFFNIAQDDALSWPRVAHRAYPEPVNRHMEDTVIPYTQKSVDVNLTFLGVFERKLGLPTGELVGRHRSDVLTGGESRCIRSPPRQTVVGLGAHTDFGSLVGHPSRATLQLSLTIFHRRPLFIIVSAVSKFCHLVTINGCMSRCVFRHVHGASWLLSISLVVSLCPAMRCATSGILCQFSAGESYVQTSTE